MFSNNFVWFFGNFILFFIVSCLDLYGIDYSGPYIQHSASQGNMSTAFPKNSISTTYGNGTGTVNTSGGGAASIAYSNGSGTITGTSGQIATITDQNGEYAVSGSNGGYIQGDGNGNFYISGPKGGYVSGNSESSSGEIVTVYGPNDPSSSPSVLFQQDTPYGRSAYIYGPAGGSLDYYPSDPSESLFEGYNSNGVYIQAYNGTLYAPSGNYSYTRSGSYSNGDITWTGGNGDVIYISNGQLYYQNAGTAVSTPVYYDSTTGTFVEGIR
jgi:hypothetical protein